MSAPIEIASTLQAASIKRHPSPDHDINPSTAASVKVPVDVASSPPSSPSAVPIRPHPRQQALPPLPDLRFEQSYLASLPPNASNGRIAFITIRDQVLLPLVQGVLWTLAIAGWQYWNRGATLAGQGIGARIRRWWWQVNDWKIPEAATEFKAEEVAEFYQVQAGSGLD